MEPSNCERLSKQIIDNSNERYCEIYKIVNVTNQKVYIGQAVSHILNHNRYRPYGREGRFRCHISEAFSKKKNQSHYLNNAIRKYGPTNFEVHLLEYCHLENADEREAFYMDHYDSLYPKGYNLKRGGTQFTHTCESKKRVSQGVIRYFEDKKMTRFKEIGPIDENHMEQYIKPLKRHGSQYGWYVYIERKKADFGGVHISLDESYHSAKEFIKNIIVQQRSQIAGTPLEPLLPLTDGNVGEELG